MTFRELLEAVKDEHLSLEQIEKLRDQMIHLHSAMQLSIGDLEKSEALFFLHRKELDDKESDVSIKRLWRASAEGQRLIELNRYTKAAAKEIDSLRSRVYRLI